ncbi:MAG TPA: DUF2461 family protein [Ignavibacteriaceae bacterium]|nr:DUF2461 family protein [Ignavibacteriaceae bacterium]
MSSQQKKFNGFNPDVFKFFSALERNNSLEWFNKNRNRYQEVLVKPARSYVEAIGEFFNHLNSSIRTEPKFNKTLMRINKDMRFAKGAPYRNYFLIHFGRFKMDSEFYVYFDKNGITYGMFLNKSNGEDLYFDKNIKGYSKEIISVFNNYKLNNKFDLKTFDKDISTIQKRLNINKHFEKFSRTKFILLEKNLPKERKLATSPNFITESIKQFSSLYPLYCFAISPIPLKLLQDFEERMGVAY